MPPGLVHLTRFRRGPILWLLFHGRKPGWLTRSWSEHGGGSLARVQSNFLRQLAGWDSIFSAAVVAGFLYLGCVGVWGCCLCLPHSSSALQCMASSASAFIAPAGPMGGACPAQRLAASSALNHRPAATTGLKMVDIVSLSHHPRCCPAPVGLTGCLGGTLCTHASTLSPDSSG